MLVRFGWCGAAALLVLGAPSASAMTTGQCLPMAEINAALKADEQRTLIIGDRPDYDGQPITFSDWTMTRAEWRDLTADIRANGPQRRRMADSLRAKGRSEAHIDAFFAKLLSVSEILDKGDPDAPIPLVMTAITANDDGSLGYVLEGDRPAGQVSSRACIRAKLAGARLGRGTNSTELFAGYGDVMRLDGTMRADVRMALRGSMTTGKAAFLAIQGSTSSTLFYMTGAKLTVYATGRLAK